MGAVTHLNGISFIHKQSKFLKSNQCYVMKDKNSDRFVISSGAPMTIMQQVEAIDHFYKKEEDAKNPQE